MGLAEVISMQNLVTRWLCQNDHSIVLRSSCMVENYLSEVEDEDEQQTLARELLKAFQSVLTVRENDTFEPTSKHDGDASTIDTVVVAALKASRNTSSATI